MQSLLRFLEIYTVFYHTVGGFARLFWQKYTHFLRIFEKSNQKYRLYRYETGDRGKIHKSLHLRKSDAIMKQNRYAGIFGEEKRGMKRLLLFILAAGLVFFPSCAQEDVPVMTAPQSPELSSPQDVGNLPLFDVYRPRVAIKDALLLPVVQNSYSRTEQVSHVLIHFMSAVIAHPDDPFGIENVRETFFNTGSSIHYVIDRDGTVYRLVNESYVAWHAGKGSWAGDEQYTDRMNQYAIGIEMLAIGSKKDMAGMLSSSFYDTLDPDWIGYTDAQYTALKALVEDICDRHEIPFDRTHVLGHEDYTSRKTDPGELFDWTKIGLSAEKPIFGK